MDARTRYGASRSRPTNSAANTPSESWLFAQSFLGNPVPSADAGAAEADRQRELLDFVSSIKGRPVPGSTLYDQHQRELLDFVAGMTGQAVPGSTFHDEVVQFAKDLRGEEAVDERVNEQSSSAGTNIDETWDPAKHPRGSFPQNRGWFSPVGGGSIGGGGYSYGGASAAHRPTPRALLATVALKKGRRHGTAGSPNTSSTATDSRKSSFKTPAPRVPPRPTINADGIEVAGAGPDTTQSYQDKVLRALWELDPVIAKWWTTNGVNGELRSRSRWFWPKHTSWMEGKDHPVVEVDQHYTPGQAAQAIIDASKSGLFADSVAASYKKYRIGRSLDVEEFKKWQQGATHEAAHLASVMAEFYFNSIATLTPAGDLVVTLGDYAENGWRWDQLISILPYISHLPITAIVFKFGKFEARIPKALARKFNLMTEEDQKLIKAAISNAKSDAEAADIMRREVTRLAGDRQIHHPISGLVHKELERHKNLRGKYSLRDKRFENLAKDLQSHQGYQEWHRQLDQEVASWIADHTDATEAQFESWLRWRYSQPDVKSRLPKGF